MIFSELYSAYYNAVAAVLASACDHPLEKGELRRIVSEKTFGESILNIEPALTDERWQLLRRDGTTPIRHSPTMPLTTLQKRWLNAIALDPRMKLFTDDFPVFPDVEPLFRPEDICMFDQYLDGDPYEDGAYIRRFRFLLEAVRSKTPLGIDSISRKGNKIHRTLIPERLEYSEKDDKFRLIGTGCRFGGVINLSRIIRCYAIQHPLTYTPDQPRQADLRTVEMEVFDQRNALERVMMHFAHFEKEAEKLDENHYKLKITYDNDDETEIVIRILAFGPMVKVTSPESFVALIKDRLLWQKDCGL